MIDVEHHVNAVDRRVGEGARTVIVRRTYAAPVEDLWDSCTNPERIPRWFLPVSGELRPGGRYQLEGNAGGTIERCDPPNGFAATWEYGGSMSWIELWLEPEGDANTTFELTHTMDTADDGHWERFGPGATGVGWDLGLLGLALHLESGGAAVDPAEFAAWSGSDDGKRFMRMSSAGWRDADVAAGTDPETATAAANATVAAYTGTEDALSSERPVG